MSFPKFCSTYLLIERPKGIPDYYMETQPRYHTYMFALAMQRTERPCHAFLENVSYVYREISHDQHNRADGLMIIDGIYAAICIVCVSLG